MKQELEKNYKGFQNWRSIQQKLGLFVYPVAAAGGFVIGGQLGSGKSIETFLFQPKMLLTLIITILILIPLCYYFAKLMYKYSYGKHLNKIKSLTDEVE